MSLRPSKKAYKIIAAEINRAADKDNIAGEVSRKIALKRLKQLNATEGKPIIEAELEYLISDLFPEFDPQVIKKAIRANRPPSAFWLLLNILVGLGGIAGLVWVLNLPYPMIRRPVARIAPIILVPSYLRMDRNYRGVIAKAIESGVLWIIHGKGTGRLRQGVQEFLKRHSQVDKFELASQQEGGSGLTLVYLK